MTTVITAAHTTALNKAKIELMRRPDSVFFTTVLFSLKFVWDDKCSTAYTNGKVIGFNPTFFMSMTLQEQIFVLIHEAMHVAYLHVVRLQTRVARKFNIAADYVINLQLVERGFTMPKVGLLDKQYAGLSTEQVYNLLPENPTEDCDMDIRPGDGDEETITQEIQDILVRAQIQSKMAGNKPDTIPGDIQVFLDRLLNPKLPWNRILQKYLSNFAKNDYSFRRPNRRFFPRWHLPSLHSENLASLTIAVDISGSVSDHEFKVFVSEVASILRMMKPELITLIQFDTKIKSVTQIKNIQELMACKFTGRGGTLIGPVLAYANTHKPQLLLVLSDGGFNFYTETAKCETLWLIHNAPAFTAPWGKVIHYEIEPA